MSTIEQRALDYEFDEELIGFGEPERAVETF